MAMGRRLPQFQALLAQQQALRTAIPKPRTLPNPHIRFLHCPSPPAAGSRSPLSHFLSRSGPPLLASAATAARTAAKRCLAARAAGSLQLFSLQRGGSSPRWFSSSSSSTSPLGALWARFVPSADGVVLTLMVANVAVYMLWQKADPNFMRNHFTISLENLRSGRLHTLLTSAFSQADSRHLLSNMMCLFFFGSTISSTFGPAFLLKLYIAGALVGSTFFLVEKAFTAPQKQGYVEGERSKTSVLGASAAVNAIVLLYIFLNPKGRIYLYFVIPVPAALVGAAWIGLDLLRAREGERRASGFFQFGGTLVAALAWARIRKRWI
uniref:Uncharacterized protein n=1 Tax=Avena sativa TaxID=4498 RepID=A0ACD5VSW4_AVESA